MRKKAREKEVFAVHSVLKAYSYTKGKIVGFMSILCEKRELRSGHIVLGNSLVDEGYTKEEKGYQRGIIEFTGYLHSY